MNPTWTSRIAATSSRRRIPSHSASVGANGFSHSTGFRAEMHAVTYLRMGRVAGGNNDGVHFGRLDEEFSRWESLRTGDT